MVIKTFKFHTAHPLDALLQQASQAVSSYTWSIRDSDFEGRYLIGRGINDDKIKLIIQEDGVCEVEFWGDQSLAHEQMLLTAWEATAIEEIT